MMGLGLSVTRRAARVAEASFRTVQEMLSSNLGRRGEGAIWNAGGYRYEEAASDASDHHLTTAGGVKLYVLPGDGGYSVMAFGAAGDGSTDDTEAFAAALTAAPDNGNVFAPSATYKITDELDTSGTTIGKRMHLGGAVLLFTADAASIVIGQQGSGLFMRGGEIRCSNNYAGTAIKVAEQARSTDAGRSWWLTDGTLYCNTATGTAFDAHVSTDDHRIVGGRCMGLTIKGFEYGIRLRSNAPSGVGFVNDNEFHALRIPGNTANGIVIEASSSGTNEASANAFFGVVTQWMDGVTQKNILIADARCKRNKLVGVEPWDISSASGAVVEDAGSQTTWLGAAMSSGGVSALGSTAVGIVAQDSGNECSRLLLGSRTVSENRETRQSQTFDTDDLTTLDVRNGAIMVEGTVTAGTRLTNIIQGGTGQIITIHFKGNTLLSNQWGGTGQIYTRDRASRTPLSGEVCEFLYDGAAWYEIGARAPTVTEAAASSFAAIGSSLNTSGKFKGRRVWDTTNNREMRASGAAAGDSWHVIDGSATVTPA